MKTNRFGRDNMHERPALDSRENHRIDFLRETLFAKNDATARSAQTLVRGGGDELRMWDWTGMLPRRDQPGDVRHIDEKNRVD